MKRTLLSASCLVLLIALVLPAGAAELPEWVRNTEQQYPSEQFITGVGQASTLVEAKKKAKAEVSKVLSQNIEATETMQQTTTETMSGDESTFMQEMEMQTDIQVKTAGELVGVEIRESESAFVDGRQTYYALAVMDKNQAASIYRKKFNERKDKMVASYNASREASSSAGKLRALAQAHRYARAAENYKNQLEVLLSLGADGSGGSGARTRSSQSQFRQRMEENLEGGDDASTTDGGGPMTLDPSPETIRKELSGMMESLSVTVNELQFDNICSGSGFNSQLQGTITEAFNELDFRTGTESRDAMVVVDGSLSANYTTKGRETDEAIRWNLTLQLKEPRTNKTFGTINEARVTVGLDKDHVASQTRHQITNWVESKLGSLIVEKLLST